MGYVWTADQIEAYESYYREVVYHFSGLSVGFRTTPGFVRSVLPPCLEPPQEPSGVVTITLGRESWKGMPTVAEEESTGGVWIYASRDGVIGLYSLTVIVNGDMNVATGRESWGMPKKRGESAFLSDGEQVYAFAERRGTRLIEISGTLGATIEPFEEDSPLFELKGWLSPDGAGLQDDPVLVTFDTHTKYNWARKADASIKLTGTIEDPVGDIPIVSVDDALLYAGVETFRLREQTVLPERDVYRPYVYGRLYDNWTERIKPLVTT
jgi:acetoacetate decarboxylase